MKLHRYGKSIEKLGQRYRLDGHLGAGGMADICLAWDEKSQRKVAIKVIKSQNIDPDTLNRFVQEGSLTRGWQHPHIIQLYDDVRLELLDATTGSTIPYLVMEYITEGTLQERLEADRPYPFPNTITIFAQLCDALQYAHDHGVIHRDLKPSNILFKTPRGTKDSIILSDFGMAVSMTATHHTFSRGGTPLYMAPEQSHGQTVQASDIFALGVILYRLCTGQMPFQLPDLYAKPLPIPAPPSTINTALPKDLDQVTLTALSEDPLQRHATARIFWERFQKAITPDITERQKRTHSITLPPTNQAPVQEKITSPIIISEPAQLPTTNTSLPAEVVKVIPYPEDDEEEEFYDEEEDEEPVQHNPRMMPPLRRSHAQPQDDEFPDEEDEEDNRHIGPALAAGAAGVVSGFALADLAPNPHRSDPPPSSLISRTNQVPGVTTQAIDLDDDDYALPPADKRGAAIPIQSNTNIPETTSVASTGPAIIDLSQRKPRTTAQLPPRLPELQPVPPRTQRRNSPFAGAAAAGAAAFGASQPPSATPTRTPPTTPPPSRGVPSGGGPRRPRRWVWGILLLLLTFLIVCVSLLYYQPHLFGISAVTLTIVPASQIVSNSYVITGVAGTPDSKQQTIKALTLNGTAQSQPLTVNATGNNKTVGKAATGILTFFNLNPATTTIKAHTVFTTSSGIQLWNNADVMIPAGNLPASLGSQDAAATVLSLGANGNIGPKAVNGNCCTAGVSVQNQNAFTGGQDPANYNFVTQGDVDGVATQTVQNQLAQQAANQIKSKLVSGQLLAESPQCQTSVTTSSPIGDHHQNVTSTTVTIDATCDSVAYDDQGMRALVTQLLTQKAQVSPGAGYSLQNNRVSIDPKIQSLDPFSLNVNAKGQWVYQIGDQQRSEIIKKIGGETVEKAMADLKVYTGIASATIQIQFSGTMLPTDPNQYASSFVINAPTPLPIPSAGSGVGLSPTVTNGGTPVGILGTPTVGVGRG